MLLLLMLLYQNPTFSPGYLIVWSIVFSMLILLNFVVLIVLIDQWHKLRKTERFRFVIWILLL